MLMMTCRHCSRSISWDAYWATCPHCRARPAEGSYAARENLNVEVLRGTRKFVLGFLAVLLVGAALLWMVTT